MTTATIAQRLVELCQQGQFDQAYQELFAKNAVSAEPARYNVPPAEGLTALFEKGEKWAEDMIEMHKITVSNPIVAGNYFTVSMALYITTKSEGRSLMEEICLYEVQDGKIVKEQFFY